MARRRLRSVCARRCDCHHLPRFRTRLDRPSGDTSVAHLETKTMGTSYGMAGFGAVNCVSLAYNKWHEELVRKASTGPHFEVSTRPSQRCQVRCWRVRQYQQPARQRRYLHKRRFVRSRRWVQELSQRPLKLCGIRYVLDL